MNVLNRLLVVLLLLALITAAVGVIALAWTVPNDVVRSLRDAVDWLDGHNQAPEKTLLTALALLVALFALVLLVAELVPQSAAEVKVTDLRIGDAFLSTAAISQRIEEAVALVPHVADAKALVKARRRGIRLALELHVDPEANLAAVTDDACQAATDVLTQRLHVALIEPPHARLHYRELRLQRAQAARRPPPAAAVPPPAMPALAEGRRDLLPEPAVPAVASQVLGRDDDESTPEDA